MAPRTFIFVSSCIFAVLAIVHALRLVYGWRATLIGDWAVPLWVSWVGLLVAAYLSYQGFVLTKKLRE